MSRQANIDSDSVVPPNSDTHLRDSIGKLTCSLLEHGVIRCEPRLQCPDSIHNRLDLGVTRFFELIDIPVQVLQNFPSFYVDVFGPLQLPIKLGKDGSDIFHICYF
jgi:hypothetical protein